MDTTLKFERLDNIALDPLNPRLGREAHAEELTQRQVLERMRDWSLEELATSFLESGFWPHEAVLCIDSDVGTDEDYVVIEGNRRIAALKTLKRTFDGEETSRKWLNLIAEHERPDALFDRVPYLLIDGRDEIDDFLGFRHVTGIKEWAPAEKAQFITKLIDKYDLTYEEVMRKIGSKTPAVQRNYISFSLLKELEDVEGVDVSYVEDKFSVLFLSLRAKSVQEFIGVADKFSLAPEDVRPVISEHRQHDVVDFCRWLFGTEKVEPIVTDSRQVDRFAKVLASKEGVQYLRSVKRPSLEKAYVIAGGDQDEFYDLISGAAYNIEESLSSAHHFVGDEDVLKIVERLVKNVAQLQKTFGR